MPTTAERGYGAEHEAERARWKPIVEAGHATCWRCHRPIHPDEPWDLGHNRATGEHAGPEHRHRTGPCPGNRAEGATYRQRMRTHGPAPTTTTLRW